MVVYPSSSIILARSIAELDIYNLNFNGITSFELGDNSNSILSINSLLLQDISSFKIDTVDISQSNVAFLGLTKVKVVTSTPSLFSIENFIYENSTFSSSNNLLYFSKLEQNINLTISMVNIQFKSIEFAFSGNLLSFQQQLSNAVQIQNLVISNTKNAYIFVKAFNTQDLSLPWQVVISNLTTSNVNAGYTSLVLVNDNSILNITNSSIANVFSYDNGAVLRSQSKTAIVNL